MIDDVLRDVPEYEAFLTVDELNASGERLAKSHPSIVKRVVIGHSTDGEPIHMLRIGSGGQQLLFFACPHPNEPIGAMTLEALSHRLVADADLRGGRYTWNIIKCIDPDSTRLNEGWFHGPFTIKHYAREFYRPDGPDQAEWTFPVVYQNYSFFNPIPETQALMTAISGLHPKFIYSLHNAGLGGGYYYLSPHKPDIDDRLRALMTDRGIPLAMGEPEMPWGVLLSPAIYQSTAIQEQYEFLQTYGVDPCSRMRGGEGSFGYARGICDAAHLVCELPYFYDRRIDDTTVTDVCRRDAILQGIEGNQEIQRYLAGLYDKWGSRMKVASRFRRAAEGLNRLMLEGSETHKKWAESEKSLDAPATVAQLFDNSIVSRFYGLLIVGMAVRGLRLEVEQNQDAQLDHVFDELQTRFTQWTDALEDELDYQVIPIKTLVEIQLGAALEFISAL